MLIEDEIEYGLGYSVETLYNRYGIEITPESNGEVALLLWDDLFSTYEVPSEITTIISDINYIIQEQIY